MPKSKDWLTIDPATNTQRSWVSDWTPSNPTAGHWVNTFDIVSASYYSNRGERSYATTIGFNGPNRPAPLPPLGYTALYEKRGAQGTRHAVEYGIVGSDNGPVEILLNDSTVDSHNIHEVSFLPDPVTSDARTRADDKAKQKLLDNIKGMSINVAQTVAERQQTMNTVTSAAKSIAGVLRGLKKGNFTEAAKALGISPPKRGRRRFNKDFANDSANAIGDGWLALQYGWKPLLMDVHGACEALAKAKNGTNAIYANSSGTAYKAWIEDKSIIGNPPSGWSGTEVTLQQLNASLLVKYKVRYSKSSPQVSNLASLGITNPALLTWELLPYSFVVDWFVPIGNWLSSLDATAGMSFQMGFSVSLSKVKQSSSRSRDFRRLNTNAVNYSTAYTSAFTERIDIKRTSLGAFPTASFPRFKNPVSWSHLASAMALLKQFKR